MASAARNHALIAGGLFDLALAVLMARPQHSSHRTFAD
jgi:hypothetical protein